jgi:hypothetical protein
MYHHVPRASGRQAPTVLHAHTAHYTKLYADTGSNYLAPEPRRRIPARQHTQGELIRLEKLEYVHAYLIVC